MRLVVKDLKCNVFYFGGIKGFNWFILINIKWNMLLIIIIILKVEVNEKL